MSTGTVFLFDSQPARIVIQSGGDPNAPGGKADHRRHLRSRVAAVPRPGCPGVPAPLTSGVPAPTVRPMLKVLVPLVVIAATAAPARGGEDVPAARKLPKVGPPRPLDPGLFNVSEHTLPNGLRVRLLADHSVPTVSYWTFFRVGSRNEQP